MSLGRKQFCCLATCLILAACGDDDSGKDSTLGTGGSSGAAASGGSAGKGGGGLAGEGGEPNRAGTALCPQVDSKHGVVVAPDGKRVAFVSCGHESPSVIVRSLETEQETVLGPATTETQLEWLLDGKTVLFGTADALFARPADASTESTPIGTAHVDEHLAFLERIDKEFAPRLLVLETDTDTRRILVYRADDGYKEALVLLEDPALAGDLSHLSDSGRTLVPTLSPKSGDVYAKLRTNASIGMIELPFGPKDWALAPIGLGDTHDFALHDDELVRVELETGNTVELVPSGSGLLEGTEHIFDREDAPGKKYVYYIQNGDPTRRLREGTDEPLVLAESSAVAQTLSADLSTLIYLSDGQLYSVPATGGDSTLLVEDRNEETKLALAFSSTENEFGYVVENTIYRVSLVRLTAEVVAEEIGQLSKVAYDGEGEALLFLDQDRLNRVAADATEPTVLRRSVTDFWPIPNSSSVLAAVDGALQVIEP